MHDWRFLVERIRLSDGVVAPGADIVERVRFIPGTVLELLQVTMHANELTRQLFERADQMRAALSEAPDAPDDVRAFVEEMVRMTMFKEFPQAMRGHASD